MNNINTEGNVPAYLNEDLSFEERTADLVSRMTLEEKAAQLKNEAAAIPRLGVGAYNYWREGLHGVARQGKATSFPISLSMSNTWNLHLIRRMADITSTEARGKNPRYNLSYWSPTVNMARDPRWGRNEETYGEDPYLSGRMGTEFVKGMQGDDEKYLKTIATLKHFVANNVEKERRMGSSVLSEETLRNYYAKVFQNIVEGAHPASVMSSYNATTLYRNGKLIYDYIPSTANSFILKELLRQIWGFDGYVTGDCGAFSDLNDTAAYKTALFPDKDIEEIPPCAATVQGFLNGADIDCGYAASAGSVLEAVKRGYITENRISVNVYNLFLQRMRTGEFDQNPPYRNITPDVIETPEHIAAAEEAAEQSWVLLKNDGILPLGKDIKKAVVVGPLADEVVLGDYSGSPEYTVTPLAGISDALKKLNPDSELKYPGGVTDNTPLMNIRKLWLNLKNGEIREIDLSSAKVSSGPKYQNGGLCSVTAMDTTVIPDVDFSGAVSAEARAEALEGGKIKLRYGLGGPLVAELDASNPLGEYTGEAGGYCGIADLYLEFEKPQGRFSVEKFKDELDEADVIIAYGGTTLSDSAEFKDRDGIGLPESQSHVAELAAAYPEKTVAVLQTSGQMDISPFEKGARAILWTSYNGQTQGEALGKVLTGAVNPSGKLTATWYDPEDLLKMPLTAEAEKGEDGIVRYRNNYEIKADKQRDFPGRTYQYYTGTPVYPFGFGLSYTEFEYKNLRLSKTTADAQDEIEVFVDVTNIGSTFGMEAVQFYAEYPQAEHPEMVFPKIRLCGFEKLSLNPGETKTASAKIKIMDLKLFYEPKLKVAVFPGEYKIYASKNSADLNLCKSFTVTNGIKEALKTVKVLPRGIVLRGILRGDKVETVTSFRVEPSAVLTTELDSFPPYKFIVADPQIARVGSPDSIYRDTISPGSKAGVTLITYQVTLGGETKSTCFPAVNILKIAASDEEKEKAKSKLAALRESLPDYAYSEENTALLDEIFAEGLGRIDDALEAKDVESALKDAESRLKLVNPDKFRDFLNLRIEGAQNGILEKAGEYPITVTDEKGNPAAARLTLEVLSGTKRDVAKLGYKDQNAELMASGCGLVRLRSVNDSNMSRGETLIYINLPIRAESADISGGADLTARSADTQSGGYASVTGPRALTFGGVKIENLESVSVRYRMESTDVLLRLTCGGITVAEGVAKAKKGWSETILKSNPQNLRRCPRGEGGIADVSIETNGADIDEFSLVYNNVEIDCGSAPPRKPLRRVVYSASDPAYDTLFDKSGPVKLPEINGLTGYGPFKCHQVSERTIDFEGTEISVTRDWQGADGSMTKSCLFSMPEAPCRVSVIYDGGEDREQYIVQKGIRLAGGLSVPGAETVVTAEITDTSAPVYTFGADANKHIFAIVADYFGGEEAEETTLQSTRWACGYARLDRTPVGNKIRLSETGAFWSDVDLSPLGIETGDENSPQICGLAPHKNRLYAARGDEIIVITDCPKCRTRRKVCDFEIKSLSIEDEIMTVKGETGGDVKEIPMTALGADQIEPAEAERLMARGAVAIDVRDRDVYEAGPELIKGARNIPLDELDKIQSYPKDTPLIFCCHRGIRSSEAVIRAKSQSHPNAYSLKCRP